MAITKLTSDGESETLEFKKSTSKLKEGVITTPKTTPKTWDEILLHIWQNPGDLKEEIAGYLNLTSSLSLRTGEMGPEPLRLELKEFIESIKNETSPLVTGNDGLYAL